MEFKLKELGSLKNGKRVDAQDAGKYPVYGANGIVGYHSESITTGTTIVIGRVGANCGTVMFSEDPAWLTDNTIAFQPNGNVHNYYIYQLLKSMNLNRFATGSAQPLLNQNALNSFTLNLPSMDIQEKVGEFLYKLDEKILLNNNLIANLEELSQTLFKRWLVNFEFPDENGNPYKSSGGKFVDTDGFMLPANWSVESLDNIAQYTNGLAMQKYKPKDENDKLPVVKIKELKNGFVDDNSAFCTHSIPDKVKIFDGDIVFSWSATLLVDIWTGGPAGLNQHLFKVTSDKFQKWFYYYWTNFHNKNFIEIAKDKATTMGHINRKHLKEAKVFIPEEKILQKLDYQMSLYLKEIVNINLQNKSLAELRDMLLPKLMSGEIELPDELEVDEHAELLQ